MSRGVLLFVLFFHFLNIDKLWAAPNQLVDFICVNGNKINIKYICNGFPDCPDGSDETKELCYHTICPKKMFRCLYGACIPQNSKCDGKIHCFDRTDESQCGKTKGSCERNQFRCKSGECIAINQMCDGEENCKDASDETKVTCEELPCPENSFRCKHGGCVHLDVRCDGNQDCLDGSDESPILCRNLRCSGQQCEKFRNKWHCPAVDISRLEATCQSSHGIVPCDNPVPLGTRIKYQCKQFFIPLNDKHTNNRHTECQMDGTWNREPLRCKPDCGKMDTAPVALVWKGWDTKRVIYPWHATMYVKEQGESWEVWCGGTLITEKTVLTAGHCVWKIEPKNIIIVFGKYHSAFSKHDPHTQIRNVKQIITQSLYQDRNGNYGSDITILLLSEPIHLSDSIHPACVDWEQSEIKHQLKQNNLGLVVGMGVTETEEFSDVLRGIHIPVVSNEKCMQEQIEDFRKYITYNVICAGWKNGSGVCNGDSGGGLLFPKTSERTRWVIQGLVSISPRKIGTSFCDPAYYTVFTKVAIYLDWIKEVLEMVNQSMN